MGNSQPKPPPIIQKTQQTTSAQNSDYICNLFDRSEDANSCIKKFPIFLIYYPVSKLIITSCFINALQKYIFSV